MIRPSVRSVNSGSATWMLQAEGYGQLRSQGAAAETEERSSPRAGSALAPGRRRAQSAKQGGIQALSLETTSLCAGPQETVLPSPYCPGIMMAGQAWGTAPPGREAAEASRRMREPPHPRAIICHRKSVKVRFTRATAPVERASAEIQRLPSPDQRPIL
jgi:hypothetical protein